MKSSATSSPAGKVALVPGRGGPLTAVSNWRPPPEPASRTQGQLFGGPAPRETARRVVEATPTSVTVQGEMPALVLNRRSYVVANVKACGIELNPDQFYETSYLPALRRMVAHVIATEGPIYVDQLVTRIARAHGFMRNGANIVEVVMKAVDRRFPCTREDGREVFWPEQSNTTKVVPLRNGSGEVRDHFDIPLIELASLALPLLARRRDTEEIISRMRDHFGLGRLREAARARFAAAIEIARGQMRSGATAEAQEAV